MEKFTIHPVINSRIKPSILDIGIDSHEGKLIKISTRKGAITALKKANIYDTLLNKSITRISVNHYKYSPGTRGVCSSLGFFYID